MTDTAWPTSQLFWLYAVALLVLGALDGIWLGWLAKDLYKAEMGALMAESPRVLPAGIFYLAYPVAIVFFALAPLPNGPEGATLQALMRSAALGLVAYGTYDLTNISVIKGFSVKLALIDMAWGVVASGIAGAAAFSAVRWWTHRG